MSEKKPAAPLKSEYKKPVTPTSPSSVKPAKPVYPEGTYEKSGVAHRARRKTKTGAW